MTKKLLNIFLIANLGIVWLMPQPSLAFSLFGPSDAEKQILFLQGYNAGIARVTATDGTTEIAPVNTKTSVQSPTTIVPANTGVYVTNPLSANLDVGDFRIMSNTGARKINLDSNVNLNQWTLSNGSVHLNSATMGDNPLSVGAFGTRAVALRAAATNTDAYAGIFTGNVEVDGSFRTKKVCAQDNMNDQGACLGEQAILGRSANSGVVGDSMSGTTGTGVLGQGFYGVTGNTRGNNGGAGIYGKVAAGIQNAYAGLFDGQVKINNGGLVIDHGTIKVDSASDGNGILSTVLVNGGTAIRGVATAENSLAGAFVGSVDIDTNNEYGLKSSGNNNGVQGIATRQEGGYGLYGIGHTGVIGIANYPGGVGVYGQAYGGEYAGQFDGDVHMMGGNLRFTNNLNPRIDVLTNVPATLGINFSYNSSTGRGDDWGIDSLADFIFTSNNRLGIGTVNPNANLHVKTTNSNAEIDIQSGNNTHWGIYQASTGGALNFWHGDNRLTINDQGISTQGICLGKTCITKWEDLKAILNTSPTPTKPGVVPSQQ